MQGDHIEVPLDSAPASSELRAARLTPGGRPALAPAPARPALLDTRFVRAELSRLRSSSRRSPALSATSASGRRSA